MSQTQQYRIKSISEYHKLMGLPKPEHPLISVIDIRTVVPPYIDGPVSLIFDFYSVSLKRAFNARYKYGQQTYDFDEGLMFFMAPAQVFGFEFEKDINQRPEGWMILVHPDFLWNTPLAKTIKEYEYFNYSVHEALYLSDKEETMITGLAMSMEQEYHSAIDKFSQPVIIAQLELLLTYADRFYQRQFITRKINNHAILSRLEELLSAYFKSDAIAKQGLPTVTYIAETLNVSPGYLSSLLKSLTGQTTQQHLHHKLIELAKEKLSTTNLSVSEIAYELGFEHLQSFSKLFKTKTNLSPVEFRQSFN
ncbi:MAG: helix-turn-helix transcriptional regulator [Pedobacter sp.]|uniref:helix-turn-helix domain-containing protein n=1 Tax=Pedobacter sp. TaxID=1411316 RepID=UPI00339AE43A